MLKSTSGAGRKRSAWSAPFTLSLLSGISLALAGCHPIASRPPARGPSDVLVLASKTSRPADLSAPFNMFAWSRTGGSHAPLTVASQLADSAEGDWLAVLPKPTDPLQWQPPFQPRYSGRIVISRRSMSGEDGKDNDAVSACLDSIRRRGSKIAWECRNGRMLVYFGTAEELGHARAHPPESVSGVYLRAQSCAGMLASVADFWKLKIEADPALLKRRDSLIGIQKTDEDDDEPRGTMGALSRMYRSGAFAGGRMSRPPSDVLSLTIDEKTTPEGLLKRIASLIGGECVPLGSGWRIAPLEDSDRVRSETERLCRIVRDKAGSEFVRQMPSPMTGELTTVIGTPDQEAVTALDSLAAIGPAALPALQRFLVSEKASIARVVLRDLIAIGTPEARRAVLSFGRRLLENRNATGNAQLARPMLLGEIVRSLTRKLDDDGAMWLREAIRDARVPSDLRFKARMALAGSGRLALLLTPNAPAPGSVSAQFSLAVSPGRTGGGNNAIMTPLATAKAADGSLWAVFLSGRCGDTHDFWLAHGDGKVWSEFLFTGRRFGNSDMQFSPWGARSPGSDSLSIKTGTKSIVLGPPAGQNDGAELEKLRKQMSNPRLSVAKRRQFAQRFAIRQSVMFQRRATQLQESITLDLSDLRADDDHDGLTNLVETRLRTDSSRPDTDGDGVSDARDLNPLVPRSKSLSDRQRLIQAVFTVLYAGDPNTDPVVVVLDQRDSMEFTSASGPVFCMTRDEYLKKTDRISSFRVLQFGGPGTAGSTILSVDGPVAYNDNRTRAEVHFWQWNPRSTATNPWMMLYAAQGSGAGLPVDYVALFHRNGDAWRLTGLKQWQAETADAALGDLIRKQIENGAMQ